MSGVQEQYKKRMKSVGVERSRGLKGGWILAEALDSIPKKQTQVISPKIFTRLDLPVKCGLSGGNKQECVCEGHHP